MTSFSHKVDVTKQPLSKPNLYHISGVDFTAVDGFGALTVLVLYQVRINSYNFQSHCTPPPTPKSEQGGETEGKV